MLLFLIFNFFFFLQQNTLSKKITAFLIFHIYQTWRNSFCGIALTENKKNMETATEWNVFHSVWCLGKVSFIIT